ncbi:MAG TPA: hypothetical protein DEH78_00560, partial [Solibacterales bacterium]|nr:hypothetical protein [Bryobacterales bacterium]
VGKQVKDFSNELMIKAGLRMKVPPRDMAIELLHRGIIALPQRESNIVIVKLIFPMREYAATILNTYLDFYLKYRLRLYENREAASFFESEVKASSQELSDAERRLRETEDRGNIQALEKQKEVLIAEVTRLGALVADARIARDDAADKLARLELEKRKPEPEFAALGGFQQESFAHSILLQLADLQRQREQLRMTDLDTGVRIANNRRQFEELMRLLEANLRSVRVDRQKVFDQRSAELDRARTSLRSLHDSEMEWTSLKRQLRLLEEKDSFNRKKFTEAASTDSLTKRQIGSVAIVERAIDPVMTAGPRKVLLLGIIGAGALLLALTWLALAEFFDHGIYDGDRLARLLDAPVLAVVPAASPALIESSVRGDNHGGTGLGITHAARS